MKTERFLIILGICLVIILAIILWMGWKGYQLQKRDLSIVTDKTEYESGGILKVKIKNNFGENICFSSCYPYLLENKNENWESYKYAECQKFDGNGHCMKAGELKAFELTLPQISDGSHRLAIPVCIGCQNEDTFKEDARFYSNEFTIKEKKVETANWKTYASTNLGVSFKYPDGTKIIEENDFIQINNWEIKVYKNENKKPLKEWFESVFDRARNSQCEFMESNIKVGDYQANLISTGSAEEACDNGGYYAISHTNSSVVKVILGHDPLGDFSQILSTFRFLE